jgi:hypothetical protein
MKKVINHLKENWIKHGFETLYVIVGILVALSLDNWNEERKEGILEIEILSEIKENLIQEFEDHNQNIRFLSNVVRSSGIVLDHLNNDLPYHDSLAHHFAWLPMAANFEPANTGYQLLLSEGVNIVSNDSIRQKISILYGSEYEWVRDFLRDRQYLNNQPLFNDMMKKFRTFEIMNRAVPRNYEALKTDEDFKVLVQQNAYVINTTLRMYNSIVEDSKRLIDDIDSELERLGKR